MENKKVTKAIIAAAGSGTRFLPQTKAMPKEMLPIMGKPIIQWIVEELVEAGVTDIIIVTGATKRALEDHFDRSIELEQTLAKKGKTDAVNDIKRIAEMANFVYLRQKGEETGNAVPLMNAAHLIGDEPFFFVSGDDLFVGNEDSRAQQMVNAYEETGKSIIASIEIDPADSEKYGIIDVDHEHSPNLYKLKGMVEKPKPENAPSKYMTIMWYLLTPNIFNYLEKLAPNGGELVSLDAIDMMIQDNDEVYGKVLDGVYHDCGNNESYLKAGLHFASKDPKTKDALEDYVKKTFS